MSKHKKHKNKKKKIINPSITGGPSPISPNQAVKTASEIKEPEVQIASNRSLKKDLIKVSFVTILLLAIISIGYLIKSSTSWYNQTAESIYNWLQLG